VFALKRKTLVNNLRAAGVSSDAIAAAFSRSAIDLKARAETLSAETLAALWLNLQKQGAISSGEMAPLRDHDSQ